ncbi:MAG TPA: APC family permease [Holophagaceae bacterium]|nr:APC family permease [Holophagaceae bacterium]
MDSNPPRRALRTWPLVGALFFMVAGGPYGLEELLAKAGPMLALLILVATPLAWALPTALMVGELGSAIPEEGGFYIWVKRALGPCFGFQEAWLSLAASVFDMAIYPVLFVSYLARIWPACAQPAWSLAICVGLIAFCALLNTIGSKSVGESSIALTALLLLPFAILTALLLLRGPGSAPAVKALHSGGDILGGILIAMWNYMGWDNASTIAGEVDRPQRTYPRAVAFALLLVLLCYAIPTAAVAWAHLDVSAWETGAWATLGSQLGSAGLGLALVLGGLLCGFGMLNALTLSYSRLPVALAEDGYLPAAFARRSRKRDAPVPAILLCAAAWTLSLSLKFDRLVSLDILLYGTSLLLEFIALAVLRFKEPDLERPYRAPGGRLGAILLGVPPAALLVLALVKNGRETVFGINALAFGVLLMAMGPVLYAFSRNRFKAPSGA